MQNLNEKMTYEQQEAQIAEKSQAFINLLTQRGILANPKVTDEKIRAARQKKDRDSYHNTLLLLQNYRTLVWVMECFPETVAEELDKPFSDVDELLEQMDLQLAMGNRKLENQLEGAKKSRLLLDRVNEALMARELERVSIVDYHTTRSVGQAEPAPVGTAPAAPNRDEANPERRAKPSLYSSAKPPNDF